MPKAETKETQAERENIFMVFVNPEAEDDEYEEAELEGLVDAAEGCPVGMARQRVDRPTKATYVGSGKVVEITEAAAETGAETILFDCELSGIQIRNLEEAAGRRVIDRTQLILDIFARRAKTKEGQLQVELAQYSYRLPRLMSVYTKFERQRGGIGMRGPGETKLESDRRMVRNRIARLTGEIEAVKRHREIQRTGRRDQPYPVVAIVGYTSAGKSTLMNRLAHSDVLADAMPFATLDPTTRIVDMPDGYKFFLTDTVGFIKRLPTTLVAAFRATLEELTFADLLLHVVDVSHPDWESQAEAVAQTVTALDADAIPMLTVWNKIDLTQDPGAMKRLSKEFPSCICVSALTGEGIEDLLETVRDMLAPSLRRLEAVVPYDQANLVENAYDFGTVLDKEYREEGIYIKADLAPAMYGKLEPYAVK